MPNDITMGVSDPPKTEPSTQKKNRQRKHLTKNRTDSTKLIQFNVPQNVTSYVEDYGPKPPSKTEISDFSAENLRNNPHPKEAFLSWRLPSHFPPLIEGCPLSSEQLEGSLKHTTLKPVSTYQKDYTKGPSHYSELQKTDELPLISAATNAAVTTTTTNGATTSPHPHPSPLPSAAGVHSEMYEAYQAPQTTQHLRGNTSRYGCSSNYVKAACGVVPTLHPIVNAPNYQTWYANEFGVGAGKGCGFGGHRRPPTPFYPLHLPPILKDKDQLMASSACPRKQGDTTADKRDPCSPRGVGGLSWLSEWAGPM